MICEEPSWKSHTNPWAPFLKLFPPQEFHNRLHTYDTLFLAIKKFRPRSITRVWQHLIEMRNVIWNTHGGGSVLVLSCGLPFDGSSSANVQDRVRYVSSCSTTKHGFLLGIRLSPQSDEVSFFRLLVMPISIPERMPSRSYHTLRDDSGFSRWTFAKSNFNRSSSALSSPPW